MKVLKFILISAVTIFLSSCNNKNGVYDASGTFEATEIVVSSEGNGRILSFDVIEGETLKKNQQVGYVDSVQLYLSKKQLQKSINAIKSRHPEIQKQIAVIEQQIATQKIEKQRVENLLKANAANQKQLDDIDAHIALLEKQLEAQKSSLIITTKGLNEDVSTIEVQIEQLNDQLEKCRIINPIDGTVLVKYTEENELAVPGKSLYKVADIENMIFRAYLTSDQLTKIQMGQKVKVFADFGQETRDYDGKIEWISSKSEFTPKTIQTQDERANLVYAIKIGVKNDGYLKIGMYGQLKLQIEE
ncbi:HlyD family efflux transporter periplasmic adaptor subunit [uncultured Draconibacterium sp.]|uniref:HlyD family secretion protein n=1 Tax=uncultured Draconibacterium sp. TaxID=1573823 RepID=UPI003217EBC9